MNTRPKGIEGGFAVNVRTRAERFPRSRVGFTLVELVFTILIVFMLMGLLIVGLRAASGFARRTADTQTLTSLKTGISLFKSDFGFIPPLVKDTDPGGPLTALDPGTQRRSAKLYRVTNAADLQVLRGEFNTEGMRRYSVYSLPYYIMGALDAVVDGIDGTGMYKPARDGSFGSGGRRYEPMMRTDEGAGGLNWIDREAGLVVLRDRTGTEIRYYRWEPEEDVLNSADLNVPEILGIAADDVELRGARYGIVIAGANGVFGDEPVEIIQQKLGMRVDPGAASRAIAAARSDNVLGVGK